eukprot:scaffold3495_cov92-Phaeocystis_antarctica.AAC.2
MGQPSPTSSNRSTRSIFTRSESVFLCFSKPSGLTARISMVNLPLPPPVAAIFSICVACASSQPLFCASAFSLSKVNPLARKGLGEVVKHFAVSGVSRSMGFAEYNSTTGMRQSHDSDALTFVLMFWRSASNATAKLVKGKNDVTTVLIVSRFFDPRCAGMDIRLGIRVNVLSWMRSFESGAIV